ncbi:MAG: ATP-binding protein [Selenomonas sp.]|nr:ATP-binding protein [Bacteroidaceae bacterium]MBO6292919.1 ATP-binding protein [Selenomonas sp.]
MKKYKARVADALLKDKLEAKGAVVIEGPKWCGKTTTAMQVAKSVLRMDEPSRRDTNIQMADIAPERLLQGDIPRLIDEWQIAPKLWDATRYEVDTRGEEGQFILTGSAVPVESEEMTHSGTGRFTWLMMRPMSLFESGESTGEVSLGELFENPEQLKGINALDIEKLAFLICRGGWPPAVDMKEKAALAQAFDYYDAVVKSDINRADGVSKNPERVKRLMRSFARNQGGQVPNTSIRDDIMANDAEGVNEYTVASYIAALKKIFVIEDMPAWNPNLRSKTSIRSSDTRYYIDPSIGTAALGIGPKDLLNDLNTMGLMFETMCVRDLRVYAEYLDGEVMHYRDKSGLECDTVIHLRNGSYGLAEIKLGGQKLIEEGAANLKALAAKIDTTRMPAPSFMMIVVGVGDFAYRREDGIFIVPIGCLKF